ncbi:MAG: ABC transporter permease [Thermoplasmatota archaeon]
MIGALLRKELRDVLREKSLITAFLVQAVLAGFSALLLTGLTALHDPGSVGGQPDADIAYVGPGGFDLHLERAPNLDVVRLNGSAALQAFQAGSIDAIVEERGEDARDITLVVADGEIQATLLVTQFRDLLLDYEQRLQTERQDRLDHELQHLDRDIRPDRPYTFVHATLLPLLVITPVFLSGAIAGDALSQESKSRSLLLLRAAPLGAWRIVIGKLAIPVLLVPIQVILWLGLFWINGFATPHPSPVLALATILGILLTSLGTWVASVVRDESLTQAAYAVLLLSLALASAALPQDPLNLIARLAQGVADGTTWRVVIGLAAAAAGALTLAIAWTTRSLKMDRL